MQPVALSTVHHEGSGSPSDVARGAHGGYTIWIGPSRYTVLRPPWLSFATLDFNHVSFDVCYSGNRQSGMRGPNGREIPSYPITDAEIELTRKASAEARRNGWIVNAPQVRAHKNSPGSSTVCPGDLTMARWSEIAAALSAPHAPPISEEDEMPGYPSRTKKPDRFRGAIVDLKKRHVTLANAAECEPNPSVIPTNQAWVTSYAFGPGKFNVVLADLSEFGFDLP